jgi:hypothetical protein
MDTPGIASRGDFTNERFRLRSKLAWETAMGADLVLYIVDAARQVGGPRGAGRGGGTGWPVPGARAPRGPRVEGGAGGLDQVHAGCRGRWRGAALQTGRGAPAGPPAASWVRSPSWPAAALPRRPAAARFATAGLLGGVRTGCGGTQGLSLFPPSYSLPPCPPPSFPPWPPYPLPPAPPHTHPQQLTTTRRLPPAEAAPRAAALQPRPRAHHGPQGVCQQEGHQVRAQAAAPAVPRTRQGAAWCCAWRAAAAALCRLGACTPRRRLLCGPRQAADPG